MLRGLFPLAAVAALVLSSCSGLDQHESCATYLECLTVVAPGTVGEAAEYYGTEGSCWDADEETADLCTNACSAATEDLRDQFPGTKACR
jgi:hypothetical protein